MPTSALSFIRWCAEFRSKDAIPNVPPDTRGIYALLKQRPRKKFDVVYIGMARLGVRGIRARLKSHARSKRKGSLWTHFSIFAVWPNISDAQVAELEGLFRHIYRKDTRANELAVQKSFKRLRAVRRNSFRVEGL